MIWACPRDGEALVRVDDRLRCSTCEAEYPVVQGLPLFSDAGQEGSAREEDERSDSLAELWRLMQDRSADDAAARFCKDRDCVRYRPGADWKSIFQVERGKAILEIGPGFGDHTVELARTGPTAVVVHDLTAARIVDRRLREAGVEKVDIAVCPRLQRLPMARASVRAAAVEAAALPAFGVTGRTFDDLARELSRVVAEEGTVFVGVPNPLDHVLGLGRLRALLQAKSSASSFSRLLQRARSAERSEPGATRVVRSMRRHGFRGPVVYAPLPHERDVQVVLPVDDARVVRYFLDNLIRKNSLLVRLGISAARLAVRLGLFGKLVPYRYLFFTREGTRPDAGERA